MQHLTFFLTYIMWIPLCLLFVALVFTTELAWKAKDDKVKAELRRKIMEGPPRDLRLHFRGDAPLPWKDAEWGKYAL
jgi:hypothetical protein